MQFNRRYFLGSLPLLASTAVVPNAQSRFFDFVLVHGTWHGGWVWRSVAEKLQKLGHRVWTPTCTGCGERIHLTGPQVGLDTHIEDISNVIKFEDLSEIILVGHSFAGVTITGVADQLGERVKRIVFFDAIVPRPGRLAGVPKDPFSGRFPNWWYERSKKFVEGYQMVMWDDYPIEMLVPPDETSAVAMLRNRITTHPAKQWTDELELKNGGWDGVSPVFIHCVGQNYRRTSEEMIGPARTGRQWQFIEADCPRDGMLTHPDLIASLFDDLAKNQRAIEKNV